MAQIQAHRGFILTDGRLVFDDVRINPPKNTKVTVFWEDEATITKKDLSTEQQAAIDFVKDIEEINAEGFDEETLKSFEKWDNGEFKLNLGERVL